MSRLQGPRPGSGFPQTAFSEDTWVPHEWLGASPPEARSLKAQESSEVWSRLQASRHPEEARELYRVSRDLDQALRDANFVCNRGPGALGAMVKLLQATGSSREARLALAASGEEPSDYLLEALRRAGSFHQARPLWQALEDLPPETARARLAALPELDFLPPIGVGPCCAPSFPLRSTRRYSPR